jgi:hypothetical protein
VTHNVVGLVALCFSAFCIDVADLADRMSIILTLLLTAVAFKFVIADSLPKLSYSTYIDYFLLMNFFVLGWMGAISAFSAAFEWGNLVGLVSSAVLFAFLYMFWALSVCCDARKSRAQMKFSSDQTLTHIAKHEPTRNWFCFHFGSPPFMLPHIN